VVTAHLGKGFQEVQAYDLILQTTTGIKAQEVVAVVAQDERLVTRDKVPLTLFLVVQEQLQIF
jgi:hypothetical protein